jgi:hypothetical protein
MPHEDVEIGATTTIYQKGRTGTHVIQVEGADGSLRTRTLINPDGTVQPGSKWTTPAPVEPANK